ncbi:MAG: carbohydrate-binding protein, partial [Acidimicrobiaceae bacterium]|nr:carbohydrate-binding protein [Acidimicrobiaceae bacterium]
DVLPAASVTVALSVSGPVKIDGPDSDTAFTASETLTFTTSNWDTPQTVQVQGQNDNVDNPGAGRPATITHDFSSSGDSDYNDLADADLSVVVLDDDNVLGVASDWSLIPADTVDSRVKLLDPGDSFRLLFVTPSNSTPGAANETIATSSDIAHYNRIVQNYAAANSGFVTANGSSFADLFKIVGSTDTLDAIDNTGTAHTDQSPGLPIWWVGGKRAASDYASFWDADGNWESSPSSAAQQYVTLVDGTEQTGSPDSYRVYTGTGGDGTKTSVPYQGASVSVALGAAIGSSAYGIASTAATSEASDELQSGTSLQNVAARFYALSPPLEILGADQLPTFDAGASVVFSVDENTASGADVGAALTATDPDSDTLTYSIASGGDGASFAVDATTGQLRTSAALDYETAASHALTLQVTDCKTPSGAAESVGACTPDDYISVTVNVNNIDEPGAVAFDAPIVHAGASLTASLTDPDGGVTGVTWAWSRLDTADSTTGTAITGATAASYTTVAADNGKWLRATASYTDALGAGKTASAVTGTAVTPIVTVSFSTNATLSVAESDDKSTTATREDQVTVTVVLSADPGRSVTVPLTVTPTGRANETDYSGVPDNVVFASGETSQDFVFTALDDSVVDEGEVVTIGFGTLPTAVTAGTPAATAVSIVDDDRRVLQAHLADARNGSVTDNKAAPDYSSVGGISAGDYLRFDGVHFDEAPDTLMVSLAAAAGDVNDTIEVRLGSASGELVSGLFIKSTGSSRRFGVQYAPVSGLPAGTHDLYFVFPTATGANINWFVFGEDPAGETTAEKDERMRWWRDAKFGQFIHWGAY